MPQPSHARCARNASGSSLARRFPSPGHRPFAIDWATHKAHALAPITSPPSPSRRHWEVQVPSARQHVAQQRRRAHSFGGCSGLHSGLEPRHEDAALRLDALRRNVESLQLPLPGADRLRPPLSDVTFLVRRGARARSRPKSRSSANVLA